MTILTIETSGNLCAVSLHNNNNLIDKLELNSGLTHSETLMPLIKKILDNNNFSINNIDTFICDIGPGSFTGIRIGVATTLAFIDTKENVQFTGISSLEALAYNCKKDGFICSLLDCKNENCYFALYNLENKSYKEIIAPKATSIDEMFNMLNDFYDKDIVFIGDGAILYKNKIKNAFSKAVFPQDSLSSINIENVALAGYNRLKNDNTLNILPMYLKKSQAERLLEEKDKKI